jgi:excisionase family DNA binding protein
MMLTVAQVADRLTVSDAFVRRLIARGQLPVYRLGRAVRLDSADVETYVASCRDESAAARVESTTRRGPASHAPSWGELDARLAALKPTK